MTHIPAIIVALIRKGQQEIQTDGETGSTKLPKTDDNIIDMCGQPAEKIKMCPPACCLFLWPCLPRNGFIVCKWSSLFGVTTIGLP